MKEEINKISYRMKPEKNRQVTEKIGKEALLFDVAAGHLYELNETGKMIWSLCDGINTVEDISKKLKEQYVVSEDKIEVDLFSLLKKLIELNLINVREK
jgi:hypothetical protein